MKEQTIQHDILMRTIKIIDIGYINLQNVFFAFIFAQLVDYFLGEFDEKKEKEKPTWILILELIVAFWFYGVMIYIVRNFINIIPFPLNGIYGYDHMKLKELNMPIFFSFMFIIFCQHLSSKSSFFYKTISKKIKKNKEK